MTNEPCAKGFHRSGFWQVVLLSKRFEVVEAGLVESTERCCRVHGWLTSRRFAAFKAYMSSPSKWTEEGCSRGCLLQRGRLYSSRFINRGLGSLKLGGSPRILLFDPS